MFQLTIEDYFTGPGRVRRDECYASDCTEDIRGAAAETVDRVNRLLLRMAQAGVRLITDPQTGSLCHSGWRPPAVNAATPGAAAKSKHMTGKACDLYDPDGLIDQWCMEHQAVLEEIGLWLESPASTPKWCHVQTTPPGSGRRVFQP